ncbi:MAG: hypothetical protein H0S80_12440 [Desulfovibrionaceae bacterium]|nr:hypothetical protein [Desulfovibrionaceae bacterium]
MADKKVVLIVCGDVDVNAAGSVMQKFLKKSVPFTNFDPAGAVAEAAKIEGAATVAADGVAKAFEDDGAFAIVDLGAVDPAGLESAMTQISDAADRRTLIALATGKALYLGGLGMNKKADNVERSVRAADIVATICYVADLNVPADCTGAIIYQALKDPNMKLKEIAKLKEAIGRMEAALQRDTREPWDKHDCA